MDERSAGGIGVSDTVHTRGDGAPGAEEPPPGTVVGGYEIEGVAGRGGMGVVYRARDLKLGRTVALKLIGGARAADPDRRAQFIRESLTAASIEHPNVLPIYQAGDDGGRLYIAMRFVEGASLAELIAAAPDGMPPGRAARIVAHAADGLDAAHSRRLVHRDVKPGNILVADPDGEEHVYLSDFGLATGGDAVRGGGWTGTLAYLAPEQIRGETLDPRTDVYALGCVLFHALSGRPPFAGDEQAVLDAHLQERPPVPSEVVPGLPPALDEVVRRAMAKRPEDRFASAGELGRAALAARYDVALLVAPGERPAAEALAAGLQESEMTPLVAVAGDPSAAEGVRAAGACAVLVGRDGLGAWARDGLATARRVVDQDRAFRLVLVLLPGAPGPGDPGLGFMAGHPWVDLRSGAGDALAATDLVRALTGADVPAGLPAADGVAPYRGLEAFREEDAGLYFGREQDVARVLERLRASRFVAIVGPSGSGKSSLAQAGVLAAIRRNGLAGGDAPRILELVPGARPLAALAARVGRLPGAGAPSPADLAADERALDLAVARVLDGRPANERALVLVDQLEEAFTLCADEGERAAFLGNLVYAATIPGGRTVVVVTMRADFYHRLAEHPELRNLVAAQQVLLGPLDARSLRRAIEEPAHRCGLDLEPGLTRRILTDVSDRPGTLPLMEHLLSEVWQRRRDRTLTLEGYVASGGVEGALARRANDIYGAMDADRQAVARRVLLRLTQPGEGTEDTRRRATRAELVTRPGEEGEVDAVVGALAGARLLTTGTDEATGQPVVDVTHEALIRGWPELRGWIDDDREQLRLHRRLSAAAADWDAGGRDDGQLYRGAPLAVWEGRDESDLNELERDFLTESRERVELERSIRRRRTRVAIGALAVVAAVIAGIAVFAFVQRGDANDQRDLATSRQLAGSATLARESDPELATLLAEQAYAASPTVEAEESLRQGVHDSAIRGTLRTPDQLALAAVPAPDGRVAVVTESGTLRLWDPEGDPSGASPETVGEWPGGISGIPAVTPAGYVTGTKSGGIVLWPDAAAPGDPERIAKVQGQVVTIHPLADPTKVVVATSAGAWVVDLDDRRARQVASGFFQDAVEGPTPGTYLTAGLDGTVQRWRDGSSQSTPIPLKGAPRDLAVSPDGALLAAGTDRGVAVVRLADGSAAFSAPVKGGVVDVNWSADGERLVAGGSDASVRVYARDGRPLSVMKGHETVVNTAVFTGPGTVASVAGDGTARAWDATAGVENQLRGRTPAPVGGVTFDDDDLVTLIEADGSAGTWNPAGAAVRPLLPAAAEGVYAAAAAGELVAIGYGDAVGDGHVIVRDGSGAEVANATFPQDYVISLALDADDRKVVVALNGGGVTTIDLTPGATPKEVGRNEGGTYDVGFSPVDDTIASGGRDGAVKVWGGPGGSRDIGSLEGAVSDVAFSPSGRWLAAGGFDRTVRIWDLTGQEEPRIIRSHQESVNSVAFADEDRIVSGGNDAVRVTDWRRGVTLLTIPRPALWVTATGGAPAIAWYATDNVVREIECDVCGAIDEVEAAARERTTRDLTEAEQADFHVQD